MLCARTGLLTAGLRVVAQHLAHVVHDEVLPARPDLTAPYRVVGRRQVLTQQRKRRRAGIEGSFELCQRAPDRGIRPAVADAVAQAVGELQLERASTALVVLAPVLRLAAHGCEERLAHARALLIPPPFALDLIERPYRLAQRKSEGRPDLEYCEVVAHQCGEGLRCLVIGRMSLEHQARHRFEAGAEALCF